MAGRSTTKHLPRCILAILLATALAEVPSGVTTASAASAHPRLLFESSDIPGLQARVTDGGYDDAAWQFIALTTQNVYANATLDELLDNDFALEAVPNLGVHWHLTGSEVSRDLGKILVQYIVDGWGVTSDCYTSSLRLRALVLGYDLFYHAWTEVERGAIRDEIISYVDFMVTRFNYRIWEYRPYLSNQSAMFAAALGLAAVALSGEADATLVADAFAKADRLITNWFAYQVDAQGSYREGVLYGAWGLRHLIYYFHARERFDGFDYSTEPKLPLMEKWFAYELDPIGGGRVNNLNDCTWLDHPLPRHNTFFDWAQSKWGSGLSAYIWQHTAGPHGFNMGDKADKLATVLWNQNLTPVQPAFAQDAVWEGRGLYYFRTGWPTGMQSDDVQFSFFSGEFHGGHAQEDKNQFTLTAYGERLVVDHGAGHTARESEAHNIVFIDGKGQHNAGYSIGTDGYITEYLLGDFGSYVMGDATAAYTTYSPFNAPGTPFPGIDWSWGYHGENPVEYAHRRVVSISEPGAPPYFVILDDIKKDDTVRDYEWRLHTDDEHQVDVTANPMRIQAGDAHLNVHVLRPDFVSTTRSVTPFDNKSTDPNSNYISMHASAVDPRFATLLIPGSAAAPAPTARTTISGELTVTSIAWGGGVVDAVVMNDNAGVASPVARQQNRSRNPDGPGLPALAGGALGTDARLLVFRLVNGIVSGYLMIDGTFFTWAGTTYAASYDEPMIISLSQGVVRLSRYDADFEIHGEGVHAVYYRDLQVPTIKIGGQLYRNPAVGIADDVPATARALSVSAYPNPFNPATTVRIEAEPGAFVSAIIYDAAGRRIRTLWQNPLPAGRTIEWDGRDDRGSRLASGVYLLRVQAAGATDVRKLILIK